MCRGLLASTEPRLSSKALSCGSPPPTRSYARRGGVRGGGLFGGPATIHFGLPLRFAACLTAVQAATPLPPTPNPSPPLARARGGRGEETQHLRPNSEDGRRTTADGKAMAARLANPSSV